MRRSEFCQNQVFNFSTLIGVWGNGVGKEGSLKPILSASRLVPVELAAREIPDVAGTELWAGSITAGRAPDRGTYSF